MSNINTNGNGNGGAKGDVLRYVNTILLALVGFFMVQIYMKFDDGLTRLETVDKTVILHGLKIEHTAATLDREIARLEREIASLKPKTTR